MHIHCPYLSALQMLFLNLGFILNIMSQYSSTDESDDFFPKAPPKWWPLVDSPDFQIPSEISESTAHPSLITPLSQSQSDGAFFRLSTMDSNQASSGMESETDSQSQENPQGLPADNRPAEMLVQVASSINHYKSSYKKIGSSFRNNVYRELVNLTMRQKSKRPNKLGRKIKKFLEKASRSKNSRADKTSSQFNYTKKELQDVIDIMRECSNEDKTISILHEVALELCGTSENSDNHHKNLYNGYRLLKVLEQRLKKACQ